MNPGLFYYLTFHLEIFSFRRTTLPQFPGKLCLSWPEDRRTDQLCLSWPKLLYLSNTKEYQSSAIYISSSFELEDYNLSSNLMQLKE